MITSTDLSHRRTPSSRLVATLSGLVCLLLAGCGGPRVAPKLAVARHTTATAAATRTPPATATPVLLPLPVVAGVPLSWTQANLPAGFGMAFHQADLAVAAGDGLTAYSCGQIAGDPHTAVVVTHDRGASWTRVADVPVSWGGCGSITVDQLDPLIAVAHQSPGANDTPNTVTFDGGTSWQLITDSSHDAIAQTATRAGRTYGVLLTPSGSALTSSQAYSDDQMRTWQSIYTSDSTSDPVRRFWLNPANGSLLEQSYEELRITDDAGQHWDTVRAPAPGVQGYVVQQPATAQPWRICAEVPAGTVAISCSSDGGQTWHTLAAMPGEAQPASFSFVGLAADGSVLLRDNSAPIAMYRLPAGSQQWQTLGALPTRATGGVSFFSTAQATGVIWLFPAESDGAGAPDPATAVFSAAYPA
jgi:hypothetical protein